MTVAIGVECPLTDDMRALIAELNAALLALTPPEACFHMSVEDMAGRDTTVFVARNGDSGDVLGCGALLRHPNRVGEVKRMYTRPAAQGRGLGGRILARIEDLARSEGFTRLVLETGNTYTAAERVYRRAGFRQCGPVLGYPDTPCSAFYEKQLLSNA
ncbi:GNAT family N-acetyltransferase [Stappia stellulata]|uniref:GNAT family N-acetyltransferase n=1 Tax=Stappia stellulata TaxID=71235 RepID=UPI00041E1E84|nr:GNAT family N-acetyltransferase [Stappia stellulata]